MRTFAAHDVTRMVQLLGVSTSGYDTHLHTVAASEPFGADAAAAQED